MIRRSKSELLALEVFTPSPGVRYSLEATAHLTGVSRRSILLYCRTGLIEPILAPPFGALYFDDESIYAIRWVEYLRRIHGINLVGVKMIHDLLEEVKMLRSQLQQVQSVA